MKYYAHADHADAARGWRPPVLAGLLLGATALPAWADTSSLTERDFLDAMPVVLTASRLSQPLDETPASVTIIDQEMIKASGFRDIPDLFRLVPGFTVAHTGLNTWGVSYHGLGDAYSRRMQVLIDGRSVYTPGFGEVPWSTLPLSIDDIDHIEVVRGPNAVAYGANAFMGVINIITKAPSQVPGTFVSAQYGGKYMSGESLRYGGGAGNLGYRLTVSNQDRQRFTSQPNRTRTRMFDYRADYQLSGNDQLTFNAAASRADWRLPGLLGTLQEPDLGSDHFQIRYRRIIDENNDWSLQFYHTRNMENAPFSAYLPAPINQLLLLDNGYTQWRDDLEFQMTSQQSDALRLVWGAEARHEGASSPFYFYGMPPKKGSLFRLFGNVEWHPQDRLAVNAGLMLENQYFTRTQLSPRLAVNYHLDSNNTLRASISKAYRSPSFFEQSGSSPFFASPGYIPSSGLKPEKILSREMGYYGHFPMQGVQIDARLFDDDLSDLVGTQNICTLNPAFYNCTFIASYPWVSQPKVFQSINVNSAQIRGADVQLRWNPTEAIQLVLNYARVRITSNDVDISESTPRDNFSGLAIFRLPRSWEASLGVYRQTAMAWLQDGDNTPGFTRVDVRLARRFRLKGHPAEVALVGQNLGEDYSEFRVDNIFSRQAYGSFSLTW